MIGRTARAEKNRGRKHFTGTHSRFNVDVLQYILTSVGAEPRQSI